MCVREFIRAYSPLVEQIFIKDFNCNLFFHSREDLMGNE